MRREYYLSQPPAVEVYQVRDGTDIILRKNIKITEKEEENGEKVSVWECDEVQHRTKKTVTLEEVEKNSEYWWNVANGTENEEMEEENTPTIKERLETLERQQEITDSALQDLIISTMALEGGE